MNKSIKQILREGENRIQAQLPGFNVKVIISVPERNASDKKTLDEVGLFTIVSEVSRYVGVDTETLLGRHKIAQLVELREIIWYLVKTNFEISYKTIGNLFDGRDHSSILSGVQTIKDVMDVDADVVEKCKMISNIIKNFY